MAETKKKVETEEVTDTTTTGATEQEGITDASNDITDEKIEPESGEDVESNELMEEMLHETEDMEDAKLVDDASTEIMEEIADDEPKEEFDEDYTFEKRRFKRASSQERKEMYKETQKIAHLPGMEAKTEMQTKYDETQLLLRASQSIPPTILTGTIVGIEETPNGYMIAQITTKGTSGEIMVKIPVTHLFVYNPKDYEGQEGQGYLQNELVSRINSEIHFLVYNFHEGDDFAYGSRLAAMEMEGRMNYIKPQRDGLPRVCEGMIAEARVLAVRKDRLRVEVAGIETTILSGRELSWTALSDLRDEFEIGQKFMVKIMSVKAEKLAIGSREFKLIKIEVSKSKAESNPAEKYYHQFKVGQVVSGKIKSKVRNEGIFVTIQGKMDVLCSIPPIGFPEQGKLCTVRIMKCDDEKNSYLEESSVCSGK